MASLTLNATARTVLGKRSRDIREAKQVPAVIYGHGVPSRAISVPIAEFRKVFAKAGSSSLVDLAIDSQAPVKAIIQEVQLHHLTMQPDHIDFHQVRMDEKMHAHVPLMFIGESAAVKGLGGTLVKSLDGVEVECLPADLPHEIEIDISKLVTFEDAIAVKDIVLPKGVKMLTNASQTITTVEAPLTEEEMKKLEESQLGDVTAVKSEAELKKAEEDAKVAAETAEGGEKGEKKEEVKKESK
jgi:large subunit ribosomal protein L25